MMQRAKDPDKFLADLERPLPGSAKREPSEAELAAEGQGFMAFASALGVAPPSRSPGTQPTGV